MATTPILVNKNGMKNFKPTVFHGPIYSRDYESDGSLFLPAIGGTGGFQFFTGTWTPTRAAAGDYYQAVNAAAQTSQIVIDLDQVFDKIGADPLLLLGREGYPSSTTISQPGATTSQASGGGGGTAAASGVGIIKVNDDYEFQIIRGIMLTGVDVVYSLATAALTTHTIAAYETTYNTAGSAGTVATKQSATALGTATSANIIIGNVPITTPWVVGSNASVQATTIVADYLEIVVVNPGTSVYHLYGVRLYFDYCM